MSDQEPEPTPEPPEEEQGHGPEVGEPGYVPPESEYKEDDKADSEGGDDA